MFNSFLVLLTLVVLLKGGTFTSSSYGGGGGSYQAFTGAGEIKYLEWWTSSTYSSIVITNINSNSVSFGNSLTHQCSTIDLTSSNDVHIVKAYIYASTYVYGITLETNTGVQYSCIGSTSGTYYTFDARDTSSSSLLWLSGIYVYTGDIIDKIQFEFEYHEYEFGMYDVQSETNSVITANGWSLMTLSDLQTYSSHFVDYYNSNGGLNVISDWTSSNCCFYFSGSSTVSVNLNGAILYPASSDASSSQCNPSGGYTDEKYIFYDNSNNVYYTTISSPTWTSGTSCLLNNNPGIYFRSAFLFEALGDATSYTDSTTCDISTWDIDVPSTWSYYDGPGVGYTTCVYGPFDNTNTWISKEFTTSWTESVTISLSARVWSLCSVDTSDYHQIDIYDKQNDLTYSDLWYSSRSSYQYCTGWNELTTTTDTFLQVCIASWPDAGCYLDVNVDLSLTTQNFVVIFRGVLDQASTDEAWAISDVSLTIQPPTVSPTKQPTSNPSEIPSRNPSGNPSEAPTSDPSNIPTQNPSTSPSKTPTNNPSNIPSEVPTKNPSTVPTQEPSNFPSTTPTRNPSNSPSEIPTKDPSNVPTRQPSNIPSTSPSRNPTSDPTLIPSNNPSETPTKFPTGSPSEIPTDSPTNSPYNSPTKSPTNSPTNGPTNTPTNSPSASPTNSPTNSPINSPSHSPSNSPTNAPINTPTNSPTNSPSISPTNSPTDSPSNSPSHSPVNSPTNTPTVIPTNTPTNTPSNTPSNSPINSPSISPTNGPSNSPTFSPSLIPSNSPSNTPTNSPTQSPTQDPTSAPSRAPTTSPTDEPSEVEMTIETSLDAHGNYFNPNTRFTFAVTASFEGKKAPNVTANISWFCQGCPQGYELLSDDLEQIQVYNSRHLNASNLVEFYSLLTVNSDSWNGASRLSIGVCDNGSVFSDNNTYAIGATFLWYFNSPFQHNLVVGNKTKKITIHSNTRPKLHPNLCNIYPKSGVSLKTEFELYCNDSLADDTLLYNFYYSNVFMTEYQTLGDGSNSKNDSYKTVLGTGNHSITAVILDENDYGQCITLDIVSVDIIVNDTSQLLSIIDDFTNSINLTEIDTTTLVTDQISVLDTISSYANSTNLSADDVSDLVDVQQELLTNIDTVVESNDNITKEELVTIANSFSDLTEPIVENEVVNVTKQIITGNLTVELPTVNLVNTTYGELEEYLLDALVETTNYEEEELTVVIINIKQLGNLSYIIYYVEYDGNIEDNTNNTNETVITIDTTQLSIDIDTDLLLEELQTEQPFIFTSNSRLSEEGFAILAAINSATYYSSSYAAEVSNIVVNVVDTLTDSLIENEESLDTDTAVALVSAVENLVEIRSDLGNEDDFAAESGDNTVALLTTVGQLVLLESEIGEEITITTDKITLGATRFDAEDPQCPESASKVELSSEYVDNLGVSTADCVITKSVDNAYDPSGSRDEVWSGFFVNLDVDEPISDTNCDCRRLTRIRMRRRLGKDNCRRLAASTEIEDVCQPLLITISNQQITNWNDTYPSCLFWNTTTEEYEDNGCYVLIKNANESICACLHATYFGVSSDDFAVSVNPITLSTFNDFTWGSFKDHPAGIIVSALIVATALLMMAFLPKKDDKPLLAHHKAIQKSYIDHDKKNEYRVIADRIILDDKTRSIPSKMYKEYN